MRFFRKKNQPGGGPPGGSLPDREIPRPPLGPLQPIPAGRGLTGPVASARATRGALMCLHKGSGAGSGAENALSFFPDAESAGIRRPPLPRAGNSPCAQNAFAALAETQGAERESGWKAGCGRPDAHAHAGHASRTLFANATVAIFLRSLSNANILYCRYIPTQIYPYAEYAYADIT